MKFSIWLSEFLYNIMRERGITSKQLESKSGVPDSTINNYLRGKTENPNVENLRLIEIALGLEAGFFLQKRKELQNGAEEERRKLLLQAHDRELLEEMCNLNKDSMIEMLNAYKTYSDEKVNAIYERTNKQNKAVVEQCREHEAEYRAHCESLMAEERAKFEAIKEQDERSKAYLRAVVRNISIICGALALYVAYAFTVFDVNDPTHGIVREESAINLPQLFVFVGLSYVVFSTVKNLWLSRKR